MSCLPNTPVVENILSATQSSDLGWIDLTPITTNSLSQFFPLSNGIISFNNLAQTTNQHFIIRQVQVEEYASSSGNLRKKPLIVYLYNNTAPSTPTLGAVYNASTYNLMGVLEIESSDYKRIADNQFVATRQPNIISRTSTGSTSNLFFAVVVSNDPNAYSYDASALIRVRLFTEVATAI